MLRLTWKLLWTVTLLSLLDAVVLAPGLALAQEAQEELARCSGKGNVAPRLRVNACTVIIEAGVFSGKGLAAVFNNRGLSYQMSGDYARSIADFDEAIRLDPASASSFFNRARSYHLQEEYDRAIADYDKAIALNPKYASSYMHRGNVHATKGDHERALRDYGEATRLYSRR